MNNIKGLSSSQAEERIRRGEVNKVRKTYTKTTGRIIFENVFSYFNIIMTAFFILIISTGNWKNALFIGVVVSNAFMGILQEIKAKRTIDRLCVLTADSVTVLRDGKPVQIPSAEVVKDDVILVKTGDQLCVDAKVIFSDGLEVDESLLTGESEPVFKSAGDILYSGSFAVAGNGAATAEKVGENSYSARLTAEAKQDKRVYSEILDSINKIIRYMSYILLPLSIILFFTQRSSLPFDEAVVSTAGAIIGMIPSGLVLISTVTLALGVIRLSMLGALINEPPAIEAVSRINVLCIDKTGTLTDGSITLETMTEVDSSVDSRKLISAVVCAFGEKNATAEAVIKSFGECFDYKCTDKIPFSSSRKYCGAEFEGVGKFLFGAPEILCKHHEFDYTVYTKKGRRVLMLGRCDDLKIGKAVPVAYAVFGDNLRGDAKEILEYFAENDVEVKVISGDNPVSVSSIAARLNLKNADKYIDMSFCSDEKIYDAAAEYTVFGRVTPKQKQLLVKALKQHGNTVAMTGDGVNDVLAMRESDCGIAMASGSAAAKGIAKIVLLNSDFSPMPNIVAEGRRVVNNLGRVSSLYLVKTIFSLVLSIFFIITGGLYPLLPLHLTLIGSLSVGTPSFFLALEKNTSRIKDGFAKRIITNALPGGLVISACIIALYFMNASGFISTDSYILLSVWCAGFISIGVLLDISRPVNLFRGTITALMAIGFVLGLIIFGDFMSLAVPGEKDFIIFAVMAAVSAAVFAICSFLRKSSEYNKKLFRK